MRVVAYSATSARGIGSAGVKMIMTRDRKCLISIAFRGLADAEQNLANRQMKSPLTVLRLRAFCLVAGVGFETYDLQVVMSLTRYRAAPPRVKVRRDHGQNFPRNESQICPPAYRNFHTLYRRQPLHGRYIVGDALLQPVIITN
jgi:hypothetical protein